MRGNVARSRRWRWFAVRLTAGHPEGLTGGALARAVRKVIGVLTSFWSMYRCSEHAIACPTGGPVVASCLRNWPVAQKIDPRRFTSMTVRTRSSVSFVRPCEICQPGVVDDTVDAAESLYAGANQRRRLAPIGVIGAMCDCLPSGFDYLIDGRWADSSMSFTTNEPPARRRPARMLLRFLTLLQSRRPLWLRVDAS